jgi:broad specificity phosphatase PhoE
VTPTQIVFETHSWSADNDRGHATGWGHGALSPKGRALAVELGSRRRSDDLDLVLVSDLRRAVETAEIAFAGSEIPVLHDWRLRECNYGELNGQPASLVHDAVESVHERYPGGESWVDALQRVRGVLDDIAARWPGRRVLIIGHMSAYWALEHYLHHLPLELIGRDFRWREGWEYELPT